MVGADDLMNRPAGGRAVSRTRFADYSDSLQSVRLYI